MPFASIRFLACILTLGLATAAPGRAADGPSLDEVYAQAIASPLRTDEDRQADARRQPMAFLQFTGVKPGMSVLDVDTGAGYATQLLALAVGRSGTVWAQADKLRPGFAKRMAEHPQANIIAAALPYEDPVPQGANALDLVTIVMNYHDIAFMPVDRARMDRRLFDALKPGGHLVVIDHAAQFGSGTMVTKTLHRIEERVVLEEFQQAGFRLEAESADFRNPADPREQPFFKMDIPTDKFALRFVKP
jgi:predicted methyltransferase